MQSVSFFISKDEKNQTMAIDTPLPQLMLSGALSSLVIFLLMLYVGMSFWRGKFLGIVDTRHVDFLFYFIYFFLGATLGVISSQIRRFEYAARSISFKKSELFKISFHLLYFFYFSLLCYPAFIYYLPLWQKAANKNASVLVPVILIMVAVVAGVLRSVWDFLFFRILRFIASVDYELAVERKYFDRILRIRFNEAARYKNDFSLMLLGVGNFSDFEASLSKKKLVKIQKKIFAILNDSVRNLDLIGRMDNGRLISVLIHTTGAAARRPAERFLEKAGDFSVMLNGRRVFPDFRVGIAAFTESMKDQDELIKHAGRALELAMRGDELVVQL